MRYIAYTSSASRGLLPKVAAAVVSIAVFAGLIVFSSVFLAVLLLLAAIGGSVVWWKTRHVRRMMREMQGQMNRAREAFENGAANGQGPFGAQGPFARQGPFTAPRRAEAQYSREEEYEGVIIEGEAVRVDEPREARR
jgi:hypothetical protein